jgi:hypothetical protein
MVPVHRVPVVVMILICRCGSSLSLSSPFTLFQSFQKAIHIYQEMAALTTVGTRRQRDFFKERVDEIHPLERYCRYELGEKGDVVGMLVDGQVWKNTRALVGTDTVPM